VSVSARGLAAAEPRRRDGWWGIAFCVGLLVESVLVSLPTAAASGDHIRAFYEAHAPAIVAQQVLGVLLLVPLLVFVLALARRARDGRLLLAGGALLAAAQVATAVPPMIIALSDPSPEVAHALTVVEDLADAALFVAIAIVSAAAGLAAGSRVRLLCYAVAALALARAVASTLGVAALDVWAPIAFLALVVVLSVRMLVSDRRAAG
jgi:hypothetical protein